MVSVLEIHCPKGGEFRHQTKKRLTRCPECGDEQAIILPYDYETENRFRTERQDTED